MRKKPAVCPEMRNIGVPKTALTELDSGKMRFGTPFLSFPVGVCEHF